MHRIQDVVEDGEVKRRVWWGDHFLWDIVRSWSNGSFLDQFGGSDDWLVGEKRRRKERGLGCGSVRYYAGAGIGMA